MKHYRQKVKHLKVLRKAQELMGTTTFHYIDLCEGTIRLYFFFLDRVCIAQADLELVTSDFHLSLASHTWLRLLISNFLFSVCKDMLQSEIVSQRKKIKNVSRF